MRLVPPQDLGKDEFYDWGRHPVTRWLISELRRQHPKGGWKTIRPEGYHLLHTMQGRAEVIDAISELADSD